MEDENFHGGDYYEHGVRPDNGLSLARRIAHITYLSEESMRAKFGRRLQHDGEPLRGFGIDFAVESYLEYQGESFVNRFDANSYLYLTRVMDYFDPLGDAASAIEQLRGSRTRFLVLSFDTDWRFPTAHSREIVRMLHRGARARSRSARSTRRTATTPSCCPCPSTTAPSRPSSSAMRPRGPRVDEARSRGRRGHGARRLARARPRLRRRRAARAPDRRARLRRPRHRDRRRRRARLHRGRRARQRGRHRGRAARLRRRRLRRRAALVDAADDAPPGRRRRPG